MALYIPQGIFHLARLLYVRPETFGPYYVCTDVRMHAYMYICMYVHMYVRMYLRTYVYVCICTYECLYAYVYSCVYVCRICKNGRCTYISLCRGLHLCVLACMRALACPNIFHCTSVWNKSNSHFFPQRNLFLTSFNGALQVSMYVRAIYD